MEDQLIKENQEPTLRQEPNVLERDQDSEESQGILTSNNPESSVQPVSTPSTDQPISSAPSTQPAPSSTPASQDTVTPNPSPSDTPSQSQPEQSPPTPTSQPSDSNISTSPSPSTETQTPLSQDSQQQPQQTPNQPSPQTPQPPQPTETPNPPSSQTIAQQTSPNQFKRNIAYKLRIGDLSQGEQILDGERFHHLALNNNQVVRVNIVANIIDKFATESERPYGSLTLDDASGQIRLKAFGEDLAKIQSFNMGDTVLVIGLLRLWNNELYLTPEIIKKQDPQYLLVRKLEVDSAQPKQLPPEQRTALKDKLLQQIKEAEVNEGIDIDKVIMELKEKPDTINQEIKKLLEEGLIYEPRPGKLRYLG